MPRKQRTGLSRLTRYLRGRRAWVLPLDLGQPESATRAAEALSAQVGGLDAVVLCAGHNVVTPFDRITAEEMAEKPMIDRVKPMYATPVLIAE